MTPKNILIVENDASTRKLLEVLLVHAGHSVTTVEGGEAALDILTHNSYDLAIVDLMMPKISGQDVIAFIEEHAPSTPVIVCTAAGPAVTNMVSKNVRLIIRKPFNILEVTSAVDEYARVTREPSISVLIVDDDESSRYIIRSMVDSNNVIETESAEAALREIAAKHPDAILLDLLLPGMPGEELLRTLKDNPDTAAIPVVVVTSRKLDHETPIPPALERADGYIYKGDLSRETIMTVLQVVLKTRP